ncbi:tagatose 1,6-diphosphate aldolase GatY/KbaY [Neobacillus niacini]|uniref:tagatose-bisphosphate aldolase subunit GatY n=1 Tax=Neobacillus niacini TaxID=86668 RepID=UPI0028572372|nr:tagatose-bisphosphate aldolase subunit GatY [Neobacillus niacini]MDR7079478.1 tagatose 1,6-diphosphate aldolase GatY/KbaY [Neobacillus niacini]
MIMQTISAKELFKDAKQRRYAIPAFNIHNLEILKAVMETAEKLQSPVLLAATPGTVRYMGDNFLVNLVKVAQKEYNVPVFLHLDHHESVDDIFALIEKGAESVMIDASHHDFEKNIEITRKVTTFAKKYDVAVEAELGRLGGIEDDLVVDEKDSKFTNPFQAAEFVDRTEIDSLAVAIGTAHGLYDGEPKIDIERLEAIAKEVSIPLVLHGASGLPEALVQKTIDLGICKVNIATELKNAFVHGLRTYLNENPNANDPRHYFKPGIDELKQVVEQKIIMCKSNGRMG